MKFVVKPYNVINQEVWTVDSLAYTFNEQSIGLNLSEVADLNRTRINIASLDDKVGYRYIELTSISAEMGIISNPKIVTKAELPSRARFIAHAGDVLLTAVRPERGLVAIVPKDLDGCLVSSALIVLSPTRWNSEVLYFVLRSERCRSELSLLARGSSVPTLTIRQVSEYKLPITKITSEMCDEATELYSLWANKNRNKRTLAKIAEDIFEEALLTRDEEPRRDTPKYKNIPYDLLADRLDVPYYLSVGKRLTKWKVPEVSFADVIDISRAGQSVLPNKYVGEGRPYIRIQDLDNDTIYLKSKKTAMVAYRDYGKAELAIDDLLIARVGSVGKTNIVSEDMVGAVVSQHLLIIKVSSRVLPEYITLFLKTKWGKGQFDALSVGAAQQFIQQSALEQIKLPFPSVDQQTNIVSRVKLALLHEDVLDLEREIEGFCKKFFNIAKA